MSLLHLFKTNTFSAIWMKKAIYDLGLICNIKSCLQWLRCLLQQENQSVQPNHVDITTPLKCYYLPFIVLLTTVSSFAQ